MEKSKQQGVTLLLLELHLEAFYCTVFIVLIYCTIFPGGTQIESTVFVGTIKEHPCSVPQLTEK